MRLTLQPAGAGPRAVLVLHQSDLVAHLRAHVHVWWEKQVSLDCFLLACLSILYVTGFAYTVQTGNVFVCFSLIRWLRRTTYHAKHFYRLGHSVLSVLFFRTMNVTFSHTKSLHFMGLHFVSYVLLGVM